jgi:hypothetical protein
MNLSQLAHDAHRALEAQTTQRIKRGHVYELLAAAGGHGSWATFASVALLSDGGVGDPLQNLPTTHAQVIGRALELGYVQQASETLASALVQFVTTAGLRTTTWEHLAALIAPPAPTAYDGDGDGDGDEDDADEWLDDDVYGGPDHARHARSVTAQAHTSPPDIAASPLLLDGLRRAAEGGQGRAHHLLARHLRCDVPNGYLYQESLKGRTLTPQEQRWVDEYLLAVPRFAQYKLHLRMAATLGVRQAALEYAEAFKDPSLATVAEELQGPVDAYGMAKVARTAEATTRWLRTAAAEGSTRALRELADGGDESALHALAAKGYLDVILTLAQRAVDKGDPKKAWTWIYLSQLHGVDLTESSLAAYHDGGEQDGQFYDSDFGGPLFVAGEEAFPAPELDAAGHAEAMTTARALHSGGGGN